MADFNSVVMVGRLTREPEQKYTASGMALVNFGIAVADGYGDKRKTLFVEVTAWDKTSEACAQYLNKGSSVLVSGKLSLDTWEKDGQKRSKHYITAFNVQFLDPKPSRDSEGRAEGAENSFPALNSGVVDHADEKDENVPF